MISFVSKLIYWWQDLCITGKLLLIVGAPVGLGLASILVVPAEVSAGITLGIWLVIAMCLYLRHERALDDRVRGVLRRARRKLL